MAVLNYSPRGKRERGRPRKHWRTPLSPKGAMILKPWTEKVNTI